MNEREIERIRNGIFPTSTSLRDILSLSFLILALPQVLSIVSCIIFLIYSNIFQRKNIIKVSILDAILFIAFGKRSCTYFIILSKCIIASELVGSRDDYNVNALICFVIINYLNYLLKFELEYNQLYFLLSLHIINQAIFKKTTFNPEVAINVDENKLLEIDVELKGHRHDFTEQPFWSAIAALKARNKNEVPVSIILIDSSKIILHCLESGLSIKLNNVEWSYCKEVDNYLVIHGLTPLFRYEIDLLKDGNLVNHLVVNTNDENEIINKSMETSSLLTLQTSLTSTINKLNNSKSKLKKIKRDENKKIHDLKNQIEILKGKISRNKQPDNPGKIKGLKHSVIQLENEISTLSKEIDITNEEKEVKSTKSQESEQVMTIENLQKQFEDYEMRAKDHKQRLMKVQQDHNSVLAKQTKLMNKQTTKLEELKTINNELKNIKKEILSKFQKRNKLTNEKFETILPRIISETESLYTLQ